MIQRSEAESAMKTEAPAVPEPQERPESPDDSTKKKMKVKHKPADSSKSVVSDKKRPPGM